MTTLYRRRRNRYPLPGAIETVIFLATIAAFFLIGAYAAVQF